MRKEYNALSFFKKMVYPFGHLVFIQMLIISIWSFDVSFRPYIIKLMVDTVSGAEGNLGSIGHELSYLMTIYLGMSLFLSLIFRGYNYLSLIVRPGLKAAVGQYAVDRFVQHSQAFYNHHLPGAIVNKVKDLTAAIPELLALVVDQLLPTLLTVLIALGFLASVHVYFAMALALWIVCYISASIYFAQQSQSLSRNTAESRSKLSGYYVDLFSNILTVRLFSAYRIEKANTAHYLSQFVAAERKKDRFFLKMFFFQGMSFLFYQAISLMMLRYGLMNGTFSSGDFTLILSINIEVIQMLWLFSRDIGEFALNFGIIDQALQSLDQPQDVVDQGHSPDLQMQAGHISYKQVGFQHMKDQELFENLSVEIPPKQKVGLVGFSGSGKTTFVQLLLRLYDIDSGSIEIDGQSITEITQSSLREAVSFIPQEPGLFHRSIRENLIYGRTQSSDEEIIEVSKKAKAHDFIMSLPLGYETVLGDGVRLSGGQRQRLAIARAMLKNAPILVLDEATSQLDSITEKEIQEAIETLMEDKTTLVIAHRLSTLKKMNRILVFEDGKIVQDGTHDDLISQAGLYKDLWMMQMES